MSGSLIVLKMHMVTLTILTVIPTEFQLGRVLWNKWPQWGGHSPAALQGVCSTVWVINALCLPCHVDQMDIIPCSSRCTLTCLKAVPCLRLSCGTDCRIYVHVCASLISRSVTSVWTVTMTTDWLYVFSLFTFLPLLYLWYGCTCIFQEQSTMPI